LGGPPPGLLQKNPSQAGYAAKLIHGLANTQPHIQEGHLILSMYAKEHVLQDRPHLEILWFIRLSSPWPFIDRNAAFGYSAQDMEGPLENCH